MIFNTTGGGAALNFRVVGNPQPANSTENCIWVDTDTITSWIFSATQPSPAEPGMVWISIGTSSTVAFSATKKNPIMVYPISAKQYVSGAWVDKTAKSYQGGVWVEWITDIYIIKQGENTEDITGGWDGNAVSMNSDGITQISRSSSGHYTTMTKKTYDTTKYSSLEVTVTYVYSTDYVSIGLTKGGGEDSVVRVTGAGTYTLPIAGTIGDAKFGVWLSTGSTINISNAILKR